MITTNDIKDLIAFAISNNKEALIRAMNASGYFTSPVISDSDLLTSVWNVFSLQGLTGLRNVLNRVPLNRSAITDVQAQDLAVRFINADVNAKFNIGDLFNQGINFVGDLLGGHSVTTGTTPTQQQVSKPAISSTSIIGVSIIGIILIILFRKFQLVVVAIIVIVVLIVLYGLFAKDTTTTTTAGTSSTQSHGGIGSILSLFGL